MRVPRGGERGQVPELGLSRLAGKERGLIYFPKDISHHKDLFGCSDPLMGCDGIHVPHVWENKGRNGAGWGS